MKQCIRLTNIVDGKYITKTASISWGDKRSVWFKIPTDYQDSITDLSDPWLNILVFCMMRQGGEFHIQGSVSASLLDNIELFSKIWAVWCPNVYKPIKIIPEKIFIEESRGGNNKLITAFSGGLDAAYTAYKYKKHLNGYREYELDMCVMMHGADIPLNDTEQFAEAFRCAKKMTDDLGVKLVPIVTNYREYKTDWGYEFGAVISGMLSFFSKKYAHGAASDSSVHQLHLPWGMNPITDQYLSSCYFNFISDGHETSRTERAATVSEWTTCLENLRVCWRNSDKSKNCGICEKCIRTKLNFMSVGVNSLSCMPNVLLTNDLLSTNLIQNEAQLSLMEESLKYGELHNTLDKELVVFLKKQIKKWRKRLCKKHHSLWWHICHLKF